MSTYTQRGSNELDQRIDADLQQIQRAVAPESLAGILMGGYGRGEGTPFIQPDGSQVPFNDYDLVVITESVNPQVKSRFRALSERLTNEIGLPVDLCPYARRKLPRCEFSLLNYEMKNGHRVLWGDPSMLDAMPEYDPHAIPAAEGTRLLLNRGKLLIDLQQRLKNPDPLSEAEHIQYLKFITKVLLAFGDSILLATGRYEISYAAKKKLIKRTGTFPASDYITDGYLKAIELKESGNYLTWSSFNIAEEFNTVLAVYLHYMPWYRARCADPDQAGLKNLMLNLQWNRTFSTAHPREKLYDAVIALLQQDESVLSLNRFYTLWQRFS